MFSVLLSQTNTSEVTHRNGYSLPSFFLPRGLVSWGAACREAVGSKDRNNILRLAVSYRVKTAPSSWQLDPLWPSSKSPKRGLSLELQVTAASLPAPLCDLACVSYVSPPISPLASGSPAVTRFTSESSPVSFSSFAAEAKPGPALFPLCFMGEGHLDQNGPWAGPSTSPRKVARVDVKTVGKGGPGIPLGPDGRVPDVQDEACWEVSSTLVGHVGLC